MVGCRDSSIHTSALCVCHGRERNSVIKVIKTSVAGALILIRVYNVCGASASLSSLENGIKESGIFHLVINSRGRFFSTHKGRARNSAELSRPGRRRRKHGPCSLRILGSLSPC